MTKPRGARISNHSNKSRREMGKQPANSSPFPSRVMTEKVMRDIHRAMEEKEFKTIEEANAFLATLAGPEALKKASQATPALSPREEAQELAYNAMEAPTGARALALAQQALAKDPDCVDALLIVAEASAGSEEDLIAGLEKAVAAGERSLGAGYFEENKGHFWGILETRPYMRARHELADLLLDAGRVPEALHHFEALLELNPGDNQGVRYILLGRYLAGDNLEGARRLLSEYEEEDSAVFHWARTLERFLSCEFAAAQEALQKARSSNRFVERYLSAKKKFPRAMPDYYSPGSEEEALICMEMLGEAWAVHPRALMWLWSLVEGSWRPDWRRQKNRQGRSLR